LTVLKTFDFVSFGLNAHYINHICQDDPELKNSIYNEKAHSNGGVIMETGLDDKTVLLTGASDSIGSAIAEMFDNENSNIVLAYNKGERDKRT